jgi:hypothetical protein
MGFPRQYRTFNWGMEEEGEAAGGFIALAAVVLIVGGAAGSWLQPDQQMSSLSGMPWVIGMIGIVFTSVGILAYFAGLVASVRLLNAFRWMFLLRHQRGQAPATDAA